MPDALAFLGDVVEAPAREHAVRRVVDDARLGAALRERVVLLDQEPGLVAALAAVLAAVRLHQRPAALELLAIELELELALCVAGGGVAFRDPRSAIPQQHRSAAVLLRRNDALERSVLDGVIFDVHRQTLVGRVEAGALGHRPAQQYPVELEAKIVVEMAGGVLLNDERQRLLRALLGAAARLRGDPEIALFAVTFQCHRASLSRISIRSCQNTLRALAPCRRLRRAASGRDDAKRRLCRRLRLRRASGVGRLAP